MAAAQQSLALPILSRKKSTGRATLLRSRKQNRRLNQTKCAADTAAYREVIFHLAIRRRSRYHLQTEV